MRLFLVWLLGCTLTVGSDDRFRQLGQRYARFEVTFQLYPPESRLQVGGQTLPALPGRPGTYVLQPSQLGLEDPLTPAAFTFSLTGYADEVHKLRLQDLQASAGGTYPTPIRLRPNALAGFWREYPGLFLGAISALGLFIGLALFRQLRARKLALRQNRLKGWKEVPSDALILSQMGRFRLVERLGSGGMASVYRAIPDDSLAEAEQVAIKCIRPDQLTPAFLQRFVRETSVLCKLDHMHIVRVYDWGEQEGLPYLVMEVVEGETLCHLLPPGGMSSEAFKSTFRALVQALSYAHQRGVAHRDLKPSNVMLTRQGLVKLMDFGLAKGEFSEDLTATGEAMGTPAYVAPEALMGSHLDMHWLTRSDQYSLGVMAYEMLCGRRPFEHEQVQVVLMMRLQQPAPPLERFRPELPMAVCQVVARMLERDPKARFPSMEEAGKAMERALEAQAWPARLSAPQPPCEDGPTEPIQLNS